MVTSIIRKIKYPFIRQSRLMMHPESPGDRILIRRSPFEALFKSRHFATLNESLRRHRELQKLQVGTPSRKQG